MSAKSKDGNGPIRPGDLHQNDIRCLYLKGLLSSLPQRKMGPALLRQAGIMLPKEVELLGTNLLSVKNNST